MPFQSQAQRRFMYARHPKIADRWSKEYPNQKNLPEKKAVMDNLKKRIKKILKVVNK